jgi:alkylation response protein AidB-like acyl-CoA dehydrogenase
MGTIGVEEFRAEARRWLEVNAEPRPVATARATTAWGEGSDAVAVFPGVDPEDERRRVAAASAWQTVKFKEGFGAIAWDPAYGGRGLSGRHERAFRDEESRFAVPAPTEIHAVTLGLVAPTILNHGSDELKAAFITRFLSGEFLACQLFSEPGAGSDLASLTCSAVRDGDDWLLTGQKVWTSGARVSQIGEAICRTDPSADKHQGMTAFLVPLDAPGIEIRPIRQMTGGASFNEVFLDQVRVPDANRLGAVGEGWRVALTTLALERGSSMHTTPGGSYRRLHQLVQHLGADTDPIIRQRLATIYTYNRLLDYTNRRIVAATKAGHAPGPESSIRKLAWLRSLGAIGELAATVLGPRICADTGEWGTYAWGEHLLGAPGYRIAGGSDEVQRNIIAERVLGLPREP